MAKDKKMQQHQIDAVTSVLEAVTRGNKKILFSIPTGSGASKVIMEIIVALLREKPYVKVLLATSSMREKEILEKVLNNYGISLWKNDNETFFSVMIATYSWLRIHIDELKVLGFKFVFLYNLERTEKLQQVTSKATIIAYTPAPRNGSRGLDSKYLVYRYTMEDAVKDGVLPPTLSPQYYDAAVAGFCERLFEKFVGEIEFKEIDSRYKNIRLDFSYVINGKTYVVEYKSYRDRYTPITMVAASIDRLRKNVNTDVIEVIIILFTEISPKDKQDVYDRYKIKIWDITNLLFFTKDEATLQRELAILTYFPLTNIEPVEPVGWRAGYKGCTTDASDDDNYERLNYLKEELKSCQKGKANYSLYEKLCKQVIEELFTEDFNYMSDQHKTRDKLFRMDIICSIKSETSFWGIIRRHYNSHFIIIECKNYSKKLEQNLIYTTEKYLFDAALRNVAIIISRNGFSSSAQIAADGCLKEYGKLILDITDYDLITMIERKEEGLNPADYLVEKLECTLMAISK